MGVANSPAQRQLADENKKLKGLVADLTRRLRTCCKRCCENKFRKRERRNEVVSFLCTRFRSAGRAG